MQYVEIKPRPPLDRFVECFWFLSGDEVAGDQPVLPDGSMEIVFNLAAPYRRTHPDGSVETQPQALLVGQMDSHVRIAPTGPTDLAGVRFLPAGAYPFLRLPLVEIQNRILDLSTVVPVLSERLAEELWVRRPSSSGAAALQSTLVRELRSAPDVSTEVETAARLALESNGRISVDSLSRALGVGGRHLERVFREKVGIGPKRLCRILRFQSVFRGAEKRAPSAWADVALDCGYYDQAHFIKDFRRFTGESPSQFFAQENPLTELFTRKRR